MLKVVSEIDRHDGTPTEDLMNVQVGNTQHASPRMTMFSETREERLDLLFSDPIPAAQAALPRDALLNHGVNNSGDPGLINGLNATLDEQQKVARYF